MEADFLPEKSEMKKKASKKSVKFSKCFRSPRANNGQTL